MREREARARRAAGGRGARALVGLVVALVAGLLALVAAARPAPAAVRPPQGATQAAGRGTAVPDSAGLVAELRADQRRLERVRERHMRSVPSLSRRCDEIIGRFCVWHDPEDVWEPPPEAPELAAARDRFLDRLASAAGALPGDGWIAGQRARYLQEAERHDEALAAARACRSAEAGWCDALAGFALHGAGRYAEAEAAFDRGLDAMGDEIGCRWMDVGALLSGPARKPYRRLACGERGSFEAEFWWLADPLYLVPGNERRSEHLWRRVMDRLQEDAASGYRVRWGNDLREILVRYGWPAGWERVRPRPGRLVPGEVSTLAHDPPGLRQFVPRGSWLEGPAGIGPGEWELRSVRPRGQYAPRYAREFEALDTFQAARFRRADTAVVVAALPAAPPECEDREVGLFLAEGPRGPPAEARGRTAEPVALAAALPGPPGAAVLSLEALCRESRRAARARFGLAFSRGEPGISDLLVGRPTEGGPPPESLEEAADVAAAGEPLPTGRRVPLYWEVYGARGAAAVSVVVELARRGGGILRTLGRWTGLGGRAPEVAGLRWTDRVDGGDVWAGSVALAVPDGAPRGSYELRVTVRLDEGLPLVASREVRVE